MRQNAATQQHDDRIDNETITQEQFRASATLIVRYMAELLEEEEVLRSFIERAQTEKARQEKDSQEHFESLAQDFIKQELGPRLVKAITDQAALLLESVAERWHERAANQYNECLENNAGELESAQRRRELDTFEHPGSTRDYFQRISELERGKALREHFAHEYVDDDRKDVGGSSVPMAGVKDWHAGDRK